MAFLTLNTRYLEENYRHLDALFSSNNIEWAVVSKVLCGNELFLKELIGLGVKQICDSRISNLQMVKQLDPGVETIYIKPPPSRLVKEVVKTADISFNTQYETIQLLSDEAGRQKKIHKIIIMIEMGELREGVMRDDFINFYSRVFELPNIEIVGIGTNLTCMYGVLPNNDKLIQLSLYEQLIEAKFNKTIPFVSGGSSVTIPLLHQNTLPKGINHFRVGETLFLGTDVYNATTYPDMHNDVFRLFAEIIELYEKPLVPEGEMGLNLSGDQVAFSQDDIGKTTFRAILDLGLLDVEEKHINPTDKTINFAGASSDMIVVDLGQNPQKYQVGDMLEFTVDYMALLRILNSRYIEKKIFSDEIVPRRMPVK